MLQLNDLLPESQWEPDWTFYGEDHEGLPKDAIYVVFEYYCDQVECDCQSLIAEIMKMDSNGEPIMKSLAIVNYDWSSKQSQCIPILAEQSPKTKTALYLLEVYKKFIHHPEYMARIKDQYARVKKIAAEKNIKKEVSHEIQRYNTIGRNDPCVCGSEKKYKKCCLNK